MKPVGWLKVIYTIKLYPLCRMKMKRSWISKILNKHLMFSQNKATKLKRFSMFLGYVYVPGTYAESFRVGGQLQATKQQQVYFSR